MLELQRDFCALLRQATFFESVGKLVGFADAHQELGLRDESLRLHAVFFGGGGEGGEVYVGSDVLFAGGFVGVGAYRVLANGLQSVAMAACELFFTAIAVVDGGEKAARDAGGD